MEKFTISFETLLGILSAAYVYYKNLEGHLDEREEWESITRDFLQKFITKDCCQMLEIRKIKF